MSVAENNSAASSSSAAAPAATSPIFALVGNPNCGKSTLFNLLTGLRQKVGNYPGVTVEKKIGTCYSQHGKPLRVIDLPGAYSLAARSPDEAVLRDVLLGRRADTPRPDRVICIADASNLERNLYLVFQILDLGLPVILVLNMMDLARERGLAIRPERLAKRLGIPVIPCEAHNGKGVVELRLAMSRSDLVTSRFEPVVPVAIEPAVREISGCLALHEGRPATLARPEALLLLTDQTAVHVTGSAAPGPRALAALRAWEERWTLAGYDWRGALVGARYEEIGQLCTEAVSRETAATRTASDRIDAVATHPIWGWVILVAVMTVMFLSIFTLAEYPMRWIDHQVSALGDVAKSSLPPGDLRDLLTDGVIAGVGGVVMFLPQILILFLFIGLLENTGYMARAAFIMDRLMSKVGLNGKSFIPLLSSYACAIPGIMATRTIEDPKDRLVTILVAPLMSCSARLPVYLLMIAALVPGDRVPLFTKVGIMLFMYVLGTGGAFFFAWLFKRTLLKGEPPMMIMELPPYRLPTLRPVLMHMLERAWLFLRRAGTVILGISIVLWFLTTYPKTPDAPPDVQIARSFAGRTGHALEPLIKPLGFDWKIGIGLITSMAAREVFVSSMAVIYSVDAGAKEATVPLRDALRHARWPGGAPVFTPLVCIVLMIYYVYAMQCMSTIAVVKRETNTWRWPIFQWVYMTGAAWLVCFAVYQSGRALGF
jgi:ferrous iron transport protein B